MRTEVAEVVDDGQRRDRRGRRMTPLAQRRALVEALRASGLTQAAFARREGLSAKTLSHWVKAGSGTVCAAPPVRFAQVRLPVAPLTPAAAVEVVLVDGTIVRGAEAGALAAVVRALRGA